MGKTPEKLRLHIRVDPEWLTHPKVVELIEKGHYVKTVDDYPHLILSKNAHMWDDSMWPLLEVTLKAARARKKGLQSEND